MSDSIPNAKKEKRKKRRKKRKRNKKGADPRLEEGRRYVDPSRPTAGSHRPWVEPMAGHTQAGRGSV